MMTPYDDVMRTIIDLPPAQLAALDVWCQVRGLSRAEAVRRAVYCLLHEQNAGVDAIEATRGLWAESAEDGLAYQERLRGEWDQP